MNKLNTDPLATPIYVKDAEFVWPEDKMFYLLTRDGLFKCRNNQFFQSCVQIKDNKGPSELEPQDKSLLLNYPEIPKALVNRVVGFFRLIAEKQNSEAAALFVWNRNTNQVELLIPDQVGLQIGMSKQNPKGWPSDVKYEIPPMPPHLMLMGDIHCHVDGGAYASFTDESDEIHRPGIHIVVGRIMDKKPEFHCEAVADGNRLKVEDLSLVLEGFDHVDTASVPPEWIAKVKVEEKKYLHESSWGSGFMGGGGYTPNTNHTPDVNDARIVGNIIKEFRKEGKKPDFKKLQKALFSGTKYCPYTWCEDKADEIINNWHTHKENHEEQSA
jgi:PRTRC genetic system protein A